MEEQDRKFGSHHHQRLRVTYSTASMRRFKRLPGFTTMPSPVRDYSTPAKRASARQQEEFTRSEERGRQELYRASLPPLTSVLLRQRCLKIDPELLAEGSSQLGHDPWHLHCRQQSHALLDVAAS